MSADPVTTVQAIQPKKHQLSAGQAFLSGRIKSRRKFLTQAGETLYFTVLNLPAVDQFSHPATVELTSRQPIGAPDDDWSGIVRIGGVPNNYAAKPDQDGEIKQIKSARISLDVVED